jgi:D-alanine-D-alanine ligase-like ATP-grasp enzyme
MKEFNLILEGTWSFHYSIEANSKEEAIEKATQEMNAESGSIDLYHTNQWFEDDEEEKRKKVILISNLETGEINPDHCYQDDE